MITVDAWLPAAGGSYQDISSSSNYKGRFVAGTPLVQSANAQFETAPATSGYLRGVLATTRELPFMLIKGTGVTSQNFHTNIRSWFSPYETARATGYLRVIWEDGSTQLRIPARVQSLQALTDERYLVVVKAEQPFFEETSESTSTTNSGNVRCGVEVELTGANVAGCAFGTASGDYTGRVLLIDANTTTASTGRLLVNGVPVPWQNAGTAHVWAIVTGEDPTIEYIHGFGTTDPLYDVGITIGQLTISHTSAAYAYDDVQISRMLTDSRIGGLWRPIVYLPSGWPAPTDGWGYYAEDTVDGFKLYLNDTPSFGGTGDWAYNGVYLNSGGPSITAVTTWDVTLADFTSGEARASLLGRESGSEIWVELWGSDTNGSTAVSVNPSGSYTELMWTIVPQASTLTTDPSLEINPDGSNTVTMGSIPSLSGSGTRYKKLNGALTNSTTGESITFTDFIARDKINLHTPSARHNWDIAIDTAGLVYGHFEYSDPDRGFELASGANSITNGTGGTYGLKHRGGYG